MRKDKGDTYQAIADVVYVLLNNDAHRATKLLSKDMTVKVTRQGRLDTRAIRETLVVTFGRPNYREQQLIKLYKKAGEPFPVKKIQVRPYPK